MSSPFVRLGGLLRSRFFRFLFSGTINTVVSYAVYLGALQFLSYKVSFSLAYVVGVGSSYLLNRVFVFQQHRGLRSVALLPLVYLSQYLFGLLILWVLVDKLSLSEVFAPLLVTVVTIPFTYLLTRAAFVAK
jgi:putative flippase GtrA